MADNEMLDAPSRVKLEIERGAALIADMSARGIQPEESAKIRKNKGLSLVERRALKWARRREHARALQRSMEKKKQRLKELRANPKHDAAELKDLERNLAADARVLETVLKKIRRGEVGMQSQLEDLDDTAAGVAKKLNYDERESGQDGLHLRGDKGKGSKHDLKSKDSDRLSLDEKAENLQNSVNHTKEKLEILHSQEPIQADESNKLKQKLRRMARELTKLRHDLGLRPTEIIDSQIENREEDREEVTVSPVFEQGTGTSLSESQILEEESAPVKFSLKERERPKKTKKRSAIEGAEDTVNAGAQHAEEFAVGEAFFVGDTLAEKEKKKRKKDKDSQDSVRLQSIPAFRVALEDKQPGPAKQFSGNGKAFFDTRTGRYIMHAAHDAPPTPQQVKQDALRATIANARSPYTRSPSADDRIPEAVKSDVTTSKSPAERCHDALLAIGKADTATPFGRRTDHISDFQVAEHLSRVLILPPKIRAQEKQKESPILPPKRSFSFASEITAGTKSAQVGKKSNSSRKKLSGETEESVASFQTTMALKEAASATAIGGLFSRDFLTSRGPSLKRPRALSPPNDNHSSTLDSTPTKARRVYEGVRKSKPGRGERIEGEVKDWEFPPVHIEARVHARGTDEGNIEENIAFSSTYLNSYPRGILIGNTKFQVLQIVPGTEQKLPAHASRDGKAINICSIAKGHVKVTVGSKTFDIGEGGVFRVRAGEKCVVINQLCSQADAVVHVCTTRG
ncbi:hypothetical protein QTJ16_006962 [Diplocarpon rosae]|uniref:Uncharacterized protein n=1 Tax=Diplocarpon rosae TaxID=946125 RepID=A0AAD9SU60_9HELO|nr:hypothetical protein QTJ16_006962 [Diplocarpon rosae]